MQAVRVPITACISRPHQGREGQSYPAVGDCASDGLFCYEENGTLLGKKCKKYLGKTRVKILSRQGSMNYLILYSIYRVEAIL